VYRLKYCVAAISTVREGDGGNAAKRSINTPARQTDRHRSTQTSTVEGVNRISRGAFIQDLTACSFAYAHSYQSIYTNR